jgi:hypothetical protein
MNNVLDVTRDSNIGATNVFDLCVEIENALKIKQIEKAYPLVKRLSEDMRQLIVSIKNYLEKVETQTMQKTPKCQVNK